MENHQREARSIPHILMFPAGLRPLDNPASAILHHALVEAGLDLVEYNPLTGGRAAIFHLHWPERAIAAGLARHSLMAARWQVDRLLQTMVRVRAGGGRVFWTVHNLAPHDGLDGAKRALWDRLAARLTELVTDVVVQQEEGEEMVRQRFPALSQAHFHAIPMPHYRAWFAAAGPVAMPAELGSLSANATVFLMAGHVRAYKRVAEAIAAFGQCPGEGLRLVVAGEPAADCREAIAEAAQRDPRVHLVPRRLSDGELVALHRRAAVALANFSAIHNSGSLLAALSLSCPVAAPGMGLVPGMQERVGEEWMTLFDTLDADLLSALAARYVRRPAGEPDLSHWDPVRVGRLHREAYGQALLHR